MTSEPCAKASASLPLDLADRHGQAGGEQPAGREEPEREGVRPDARADDAAGRAAETEREGDLVVVHARVPVRRRDDLRVARVDLDEVAVGQLHLVEPARRDRERPAPGDAGDRIGQLVEPAVVARAPVARARGAGRAAARGPRRGAAGGGERAQARASAPVAKARGAEASLAEAAPASGGAAARRGDGGPRVPPSAPRSTRPRTPASRGRRRAARPTPRGGSARQALGLGAGAAVAGSGTLAAAAVAAVTAASAAGSPAAAPHSTRTSSRPRVSKQRLDDRLLDGDEALRQRGIAPALERVAGRREHVGQQARLVEPVVQRHDERDLRERLGELRRAPAPPKPGEGGRRRPGSRRRR